MKQTFKSIREKRNEDKKMQKNWFSKIKQNC